MRRDLYVAANPTASVNSNLANNHLANYTEESLAESIIDYSAEHNAHVIPSTTDLGKEILSLIQIGKIAMGEEYDIIPSDNPALPSLLLVRTDISDKIKAHLLSERDKLPYRDPSAVTVELVRMDGLPFNSTQGLIDTDSPIESMQNDTVTKKQNQISVDIEEEYVVARAAQ